MYLAYINIRCWINIANIRLHGPDDGPVESKRYSVDCSINISFHLDYLVLFGPVKPELGVIPPGQENYSKANI